MNYAVVSKSFFAATILYYINRVLLNIILMKTIKDASYKIVIDVTRCKFFLLSQRVTYMIFLTIAKIFYTTWKK